MYFLGVDGGGTKTTAVLIDADGQLIRKIDEGPGNAAVLDRGTMARLIHSIFRQLQETLTLDDITWATFGFAGAGRPQEKRNLKEIISGIGLQNFTLMNDAEVHYYSVFGDECGIMLSAGTGSICLVRNADGQLQQIGGVGYLLGDEGSGFAIGRQAIGGAVQAAYDGLPVSQLAQKLLSFYGLLDRRDLISIIYASKNPQRLIASSAKLVTELAAGGDKEALEIVGNAVESLMMHLKKAMTLTPAEEACRIAFTGGLLKGENVVSNLLQKSLDALGSNYQLARQEFIPAVAAAFFSISASGNKISADAIQRLKTI